MKTKILYVVVCDESHNYIEQAAISAYSVKYYNPSAHVALLVDEKTNELISTNRSLLKNFVSEVVVISVPKEYSNNKMASRYIKTTARKWIEGDYLFIDTDTVVCGDLSSIDDFDVNAGAVFDLHVTLEKSGYLDMVSKQARAMDWNLSSLDYEYFNSGVMLVKDTPITHTLYNRWHDNWKKKAKLGLYTDQPALAYANCQCDYTIKELPGIWNCQLFVNGLPYLSDAKIIHYFSSGVNKKTKEAPYYFLSNKLLNYIKLNQKFPEDFDDYIQSPKTKAFPMAKTQVIAGEDCDLFKSDVVRFIYSQYYYYPHRFALIKKMVALYYKLKLLKG